MWRGREGGEGGGVGLGGTPRGAPGGGGGGGGGRGGGGGGEVGGKAGLAGPAALRPGRRLSEGDAVSPALRGRHSRHQQARRKPENKTHNHPSTVIDSHMACGGARGKAERRGFFARLPAKR